MPSDPPEPRPKKSVPQLPKSSPFVTAFALILGGFIAVTMVSVRYRSPDWEEAVSVIGVASLVSGASAAIGIILGLLFGLPRLSRRLANQRRATSLTANKSDEERSAEDRAQPEDQRRLPFSANGIFEDNTNLEDISDWLTKILVGAGLTQIREIPGIIQRAASYLAPGLGNDRVSEPFAAAIIVCALGSGFLFGYQWTRLYLPIYLEKMNASRAEVYKGLAEEANRPSESDSTPDRTNHGDDGERGP